MRVDVKGVEVKGTTIFAVLLITIPLSFYLHGYQKPKSAPVVAPKSTAESANDCPKHIVVGSYTYELVADDPGGTERATINYDREVIVVAPDLPRDIKTETIIHELEHAAAHETIGRTADYFQHHTYRDDQWIEATAPILTKTLQRYPELLTCELN